MRYIYVAYFHNYKQVSLFKNWAEQQEGITVMDYISSNKIDCVRFIGDKEMKAFLEGKGITLGIPHAIR